MGNDGNTTAGAVLLEDRGCHRESSTGICDVIDKHRDFVGHIANQNHTAHLICDLAFFMDQGEVDMEPVGNGSGTSWSLVGAVEVLACQQHTVLRLQHRETQQPSHLFHNSVEYTRPLSSPRIAIHGILQLDAGPYS